MDPIREGPARLAGAGPAALANHCRAGFAGPVADGKLILFHRIDNEEIVDCLNAVNGRPFGARVMTPITWMISDSTTARGPCRHCRRPRLHPWRSRRGARVGFENRQGPLETDARTQFKAPKGFLDSPVRRWSWVTPCYSISAVLRPASSGWMWPVARCAGAPRRTGQLRLARARHH